MLSRKRKEENGEKRGERRGEIEEGRMGEGIEEERGER